LSDDLEYEFYEKFFFAKGVEPYPVQEQALGKIFAGESLLVTVPTGTGKTLMAKGALYRALRRGERAIYTTPLRALTEEKFRELEADFGEENVGFATGDYKVRPEAPIQVVVAEILWNRILADRVHAPADVVVMDEGHYFNDPERGYVWEQSIIGLDPRTQLVILSATVGEAERFAQWVYLTRRVPMALVESTERRVPLYHEYREEYLIESVKKLDAGGEVPVIVFVFSRNDCYEKARLVKSCPRFTSDEDRARITELMGPILNERGFSKELKPLLLHGIGIHHAGILPRYKQLVEKLTLERLLRVVVSTETISAGINLPAKRVIFPELRKFIQGKARLLIPAEYHQMAGRAGRPQFDTEGVAITLAPDEVVKEIRQELKASGGKRDEAKLKKGIYSRVRADAVKNGDVTWDPDAHAKLVAGQAAALRSQTKITAEQILAIGLPDLTASVLPGTSETPTPMPRDEMPACMNLDISTMIDHLLLPPHERWEQQKRLAQVTANMQALGVLDEHGRQVAGQVIQKLRGLDGLFVYFALMNADLQYPLARELVELQVDHDVIQKVLSRATDEEKREWCRNRLRERRREEPQVSWEDVEEEYDRAHPRELTPIEKLYQDFLGKLPHPELHGGRRRKAIWAEMEDENLGFMDFVEKHGLAAEEGNLFSYLARVMKFAKMLADATGLGEFETLALAVRERLSVVDDRVLAELG
jgi:superfamily II DNA/RNA helicase